MDEMQEGRAKLIDIYLFQFNVGELSQIWLDCLPLSKPIKCKIVIRYYSIK